MSKWKAASLGQYLGQGGGPGGWLRWGSEIQTVKPCLADPLCAVTFVALFSCHAQNSREHSASYTLHGVGLPLHLSPDPSLIVGVLRALCLWAWRLGKDWGNKMQQQFPSLKMDRMTSASLSAFFFSFPRETFHGGRSVTATIVWGAKQDWEGVKREMDPQPAVCSHPDTVAVALVASISRSGVLYALNEVVAFKFCPFSLKEDSVLTHSPSSVLHTLPVTWERIVLHLPLTTQDPLTSIAPWTSRSVQNE